MTERAPGLNRRDFMRLGLVAPAALVAACGWDGGPVLEPRLRAISRLNDWVGEKILLSPTRLAPQYPAAARTAAVQFPAYSITRNRTGRSLCRPTARRGRSRSAAWCGSQRGSPGR